MSSRPDCTTGEAMNQTKPGVALSAENTGFGPVRDCHPILHLSFFTAWVQTQAPCDPPLLGNAAVALTTLTSLVKGMAEGTCRHTHAPPPHPSACPFLIS